MEEFVAAYTRMPLRPTTTSPDRNGSGIWSISNGETMSMTVRTPDAAGPFGTYASNPFGLYAAGPVQGPVEIVAITLPAGRVRTLTKPGAVPQLQLLTHARRPFGDTDSRLAPAGTG